METMLEQIVQSKKRRLFRKKPDSITTIPGTDENRSSRITALLADAISRPSDQGKRFRESMTHQPGPNIIAEIKAASPSRGTIMPSVQFPVIAQTIDRYESSGAAAISVVTEEEFFGGSPELLKQVVQSTHLPVLRKDFVIEESQIFESYLLGVSALLLIARIISLSRLKHFIGLCDLIGLTPLVEVHDQPDLHKALTAGARIIGINNRNLATLDVSVEHTLELVPSVPAGIILVSESGFRNRQTIQQVMEAGVNNFLIGEALLLSDQADQTILELRGANLCLS